MFTLPKIQFFFGSFSSIFSYLFLFHFIIFLYQKSRLSEEMKTVLEHWDKKESPETKEYKENKQDNRQPEGKHKNNNKTDLKSPTINLNDSTSLLPPPQPLPSSPQEKQEKQDKYDKHDKQENKTLKKDRDYTNAVGNWVAARRTNLSSKNLGEFKKSRGSDLSVGSDDGESSPKEQHERDWEDNAVPTRSENGKDENQLAASSEIHPPTRPKSILSQSEEIPPPLPSKSFTKSVSFREVKIETPAIEVQSDAARAPMEPLESPQAKPDMAMLPRIRGEDGTEFGGYFSMAPRRVLPPVPAERIKSSEGKERPDRELPPIPPEKIRPDNKEKPEKESSKEKIEKEKPDKENSKEKIEKEKPEKENLKEKIEKPELPPRLDRPGSKKGANLLTLRDKGRTTMRTFNIFGSKVQNLIYSYQFISTTPPSYYKLIIIRQFTFVSC